MAKKSKFLSWLGFGKKDKQAEQTPEVQSEVNEGQSTAADTQETAELSTPAQQQSEPVEQQPQQEEIQSPEPQTPEPVVQPIQQDDVQSKDAQTPHPADLEQETSQVEGISEVNVSPFQPEASVEINPSVADIEDQANLTSEQDASEEQTVPTAEPIEEATVQPETQIEVAAQPVTPILAEADKSSQSEHFQEELQTDATSEQEPAQPTEESTELVDQEEVSEEAEKEEKVGFFARLKRSLVKTKENIGSGFASLFRGKKIDDELFEELETQLLIADVGVETTMKMIDSLTDQADRKQLKDGEALYELLRDEMASMLEPVSKPLDVSHSEGPFVILMVGVNGVGKTTTIGKMAKQFQAEGKSVMLAAGDTFRAAAVEQLQVWGERNDIPVVAQHTGADSASVLYDAYEAAKARGVDVLIADTAGRLQNKNHLMEELKKITRVMKKIDANAPHEIMLTIDAGTGQNAISQAQLFHDAVGLTGITLTKLDGTAKGGVIFAVADQFQVPIRYIGVGESIDDLRTFNGQEFIEALFSKEDAA